MMFRCNRCLAEIDGMCIASPELEQWRMGCGCLGKVPCPACGFRGGLEVR